MNSARISTFNNGDDGRKHRHDKYLNINNGAKNLVIIDDDDCDGEHWNWHLLKLPEEKPQPVHNQLLELESGNNGDFNRVTLPLDKFPVFNNAPILKRNGFQARGENFQQYLGNKKETVTLSSTSTSPNLNTRWLPKKHVEKVISIVRYRCQFCGKDFCSPTYLGRHMNMAHGIVPPTQTVVEIQQPQSAIGVQDGGVQEGLTPPVRRQQEKEIRDGYQGEEPCFICGLVFSTASQLMMHEKVHAATGESASFNEPVPIQPDDEDDDPVNDEEFRNNVINLVGIENDDDEEEEEEEEDVGHTEDVQVQPMEMDSNDFEIPHSEHPVSEQEHCVKKHAPPLEDEKSQTQTIRASRAHLHGHGPGRPEKAESLPQKSQPEASAKAVVLASGTRPEFEQKMRLKNKDSTVKVTPPTLLCQDEEICIIKGHDEGQGKRDSRLRQNPKRKRFDEYENHLTPNPRETQKKQLGVKSDPKLNSIGGKQTRGHPKMDADPRSLRLELEHLNPRTGVEVEKQQNLKKPVIQQTFLDAGLVTIKKSNIHGHELTAFSES